MSAPQFIFSRPQDNLIARAVSMTLTTGVLSGDSTLACLNDGNPGSPFRIVGTSLKLDFAFSAPVLPEFPAIIHSNLSVAARLQGDDSDLDSPAVDLPFDVPVIARDGLFSAPWLDLRDETPKTLWRLTVVGNSRPIIIGELWLGRKFRTLAVSGGFGAGNLQHVSGAQSVVQETNAGTELAYQQAVRREALSGGLSVSGDEWDAVRAWHTSAGRQPFVVVPLSDRDGAHMVRFAADGLTDALVGPTEYGVAVSLRQVSYGLAWIDPEGLPDDDEEIS